MFKGYLLAVNERSSCTHLYTRTTILRHVPVTVMQGICWSGRAVAIRSIVCSGEGGSGAGESAIRSPHPPHYHVAAVDWTYPA